MHDVINSVGDGTMSPRMSDRSVRSIPDLVNQGPGAKVAPFRGKRLSEEEEQQIRGYLRDIRNHHFPIWLGLMMKVLQSGRTPKKLLRKKYHEILGGEWVLDYERIDRIARGDIRFACEKYFDSNCVGKELREEFAGTFDEAYSKIEDGGLRVFGELITEWAMKCKESRSKTDVMLFSMFVACVCKAGWVEAEPKYGQFIRWSQEMAPEPLKSVCREHFRWAFPRLFCDVYPGMLDMFKDDEDIVQRPLLEQNLAERRVASSHQHLSV